MFLYSQTLKKVLIKMEWRKGELLLDFLHDKLEDEFHVFLVPFIRAHGLDSLYVLIEKLLNLIGVAYVVHLCSGNSLDNFQQNYLL